MIEIETYSGTYEKEIISLILNIQNNEAKINLSLAEQPDLENIYENYQAKGGNFWIAIHSGCVIGTIGLMMKNNKCAILKKFFVMKEFRSQKVGLTLYQRLLEYALEKGVEHIILDTPSVAKASHKFYEQNGFRCVVSDDLPIKYNYPDRDSILYMLDL